MSSLNYQQSNQIRLYESLGQIVVSFGALEQTVEAIIFCAMPSTIVQAKVLFRSMTFAAKVSAMHSALRELHTDQELNSFLVTLNEFVERSHYCEQRRNEWVRSCWIPELASDSGTVYRLQPDPCKEKALALEKIPLLELECFLVCLNSTVAYLCAFHRRLFVNFGRLRDCQAFNEYLCTPLHVSNDPTHEINA